MPSTVKLLGLVLLLAGSARSAESQDSPDPLAPVGIRLPTIEPRGNASPPDHFEPGPQGPFERSRTGNVPADFESPVGLPSRQPALGSPPSDVGEKPAANNASGPQSLRENAAAAEQPAPVAAIPLPLAPPGQSVRGGNPGKSGALPGLPSLAGVGSSLALVLGLFFIVAWLMRRTTPGNCPLLPGEVVEILGRAPLTARSKST